MWEHRTQDAAAGAPRSGKTFYIETVTRNYIQSGQGAALVYNPGKFEDWADFEIIRPLTKVEHIRYFYAHDKEAKRWFNAAPRMEYFERETEPGVYYHFNQFTELFWGQGAKMFAPDRKNDNPFFDTVYNNISSTMLIIDDIRKIVRRGLPTALSGLLSSQNHAGRLCSVPELSGKGVDISMMFHAVDAINPEVWQYLTHLTMFDTGNRPPRRGFLDENRELEDVVLKTWNELRDMPRHTAASFFLRGRELERDFINPEDVAALRNQLA